ncbi:MAG: Glycine betaine transporter OpuD [uncultured Acidimicrobiales bacterium]|uniref:Glycine betaine transporter OpuD n=1 Tax=uncultured Acidimicrobiales bacterium TaxID=310071 RepID=A0A6J4HQ58_9ACTN|nr:MAG: Glycine betaine transporter OpuD [uncultured Acidimicrobiales bacterium]
MSIKEPEHVEVRTGQDSTPVRDESSLGVDMLVFGVAAVLAVGFVLVGAVWPEELAERTSTALTWVTNSFGWLFVLTSAAFVLFSAYLALTRYGNIKLGPDDSVPEFSTFSWVSMMFAAGLGAGLLFYGIAEPVSHWSAPPHGLAEPRSEEASLVALRYTYFHWGFNGWAMYAVMGGAMAYFSFRRGLPTLVSATFTPLLGPNASEKPLGRLVDALAIVATLFGTATALGLNGLQLNSGLEYLLDVPKSNGVAVLIIVVVTTLFLVSATSGVEKGINFLANLGMFATIGLFLFFLVVGGSTVLVVSNGIESIGTYIIQVLPMSLQTGVGDEQWMAGWTIFYWAWWVSWAPFVGMFVARISRGRTIREFVLGVVAAPTGFGFLWFAIVGGTGIELQRSGKADIVGALATPELSLFTALDVLPLPLLSSALCVVLIALFFISGADAASVVMATMASRGSLRPPRVVVVVLGVLMGGIACAMLLVGGLTALQQAAVLGSVPFTVVLIGVAYCWIKALREEPRTSGPPVREAERPEVVDA